MPLDPAKIGLAVQSGLSVVCATCTKYWEGRDKGLPEPQCTSQVPCGSPLAGDTFSQYSGPLKDFEQWCFRCGASASHLVALKGHVRRLALCREHVGMLNSLRPQSPIGRENPLVQHDGRLIRPEDLLPKKREAKTLSELLMEPEKK